MPYISEKLRKEVGAVNPLNPGELNYAFTMLLIGYAERMISTDHPMSYQLLNDIAGALELAKAEYIRRVVNPYEDRKIAENGDVYPFPLAGPRKVR